MKKTAAFILTLCFLITLTACSKEGPAEKAGKKLDKTMEDTKKAADDAKESVKKLFKK